MNVILAKSAGFCWGVERAIDIARDYASKGRRPVFTDGPLIHNSQMMERLVAEGIKEVGDYQSQSDIAISEDERDNAVMVVRAHGISPERRKYLKSIGLEFRDATCPDVGIIAGKIRQHARKGFSTIIFGDPKHPEVIGLMGYTNGQGHVVRNESDLRALPPLGDKVCMVSQSTMFTDEFERLGSLLRQTDVLNLKKEGAQAIVVIGGRHSANTKKLALLVENQGIPAYHVETVRELDVQHLKDNYESVGVTAGASTPEFLIREVVDKLQAA